MYFRNFVIISPWRKTEPFIQMNLNSFTQRWIVTSLVEIGTVELEKMIF